MYKIEMMISENANERFIVEQMKVAFAASYEISS